MPCHTRYTGVAKSVVVPWKRTEITIDQDMIDEYGDVHGHISTVNTAFSSDGDYIIQADLFDESGANVLMTERFLYLEKEDDLQLAGTLAAYGVQSIDGCTPEEAINLAAQEWMTQNYREFVHSHDTPQDVYIIGGS